MRYELKAIFRSRFTRICLFISIFLGIWSMLQMKNVIGKDYSTENLLDIYEMEYSSCQENVGRLEDGWDYYSTSWCDSEEDVEELEREYQCIVWARDSWKELSKMLESGEYSREELNREEFRIRLIITMADTNMNCWTDLGETPVEQVYARELAELEDVIRLKELPFDLSKLADSSLNNGIDREDSAPLYYQGIQQTAMYLEYLRYPEAKGYYTNSPYSLWAVMSQNDSFVGTAFGCVILFFTSFYMMECRKNRSRQLQEVRPEGTGKICAGYFKSVFLAALLIVAAGVAVPSLMLGAEYGWSGIHTTVLVDSDNFTGWMAYENYGIWHSYFLGKQYSDYKLEGNVYDITLHPMKELELWQFLPLVLILLLLKFLFLSIVGFTIGYAIKRRGIAIMAAALAAGIFAYSQRVSAGMKWNPLAVQTAWDVTTGGMNMTWLNAVVVLLLGTVVTAGILVATQRKRDYC